MTHLNSIEIIVLIAGLVIALFINASEFRPIITRETNLKTRKEKNQKVEKYLAIAREGKLDELTLEEKHDYEALIESLS